MQVGDYVTVIADREYKTNRQHVGDILKVISIDEPFVGCKVLHSQSGVKVDKVVLSQRNYQFEALTENFVTNFLKP